MDYFLWSLAVLLVLSGIVGLILPALPGSPLLFAGHAKGSLQRGRVYPFVRTKREGSHPPCTPLALKPFILH